MPKQNTQFSQELLYSEQAAASLLGLGRFVLLRERQRGAIGFYKFGGCVYYTEHQLKEYKQRCERPALPKAA